MGEIMNEISAKELAKSERIGIDALRARWNTLCAERPDIFRERWDKNRPINFAQETALRSAKTEKKKTVSVRSLRAGKLTAALGQTALPDEVAPPVADESKIDISAIRRFAFDAVCILIVVGHAALIWYDCAQMWDTPGVIGGGLSFLFVLGAVLIATDKTRERTSGYALGFMFFVDVAAFFVHFPTFLKYAEIGEIQTGALCGFICLLSFAALYLYQDSKLD